MRARCQITLAIAALVAGCASTVDQQGQVDSMVNRMVTYMADPVGGDQWRTDCSPTGDCEDYALCKARLMLLRGLPVDDMAVVVGDVGGTAHAVLRYRGMVYDNRTWPRTWAGLAAADFKPLYACYVDGRADRYIERNPSLNPSTVYVVKGFGVISSKVMPMRCREAIAELQKINKTGE